MSMTDFHAIRPTGRALAPIVLMAGLCVGLCITVAACEIAAIGPEPDAAEPIDIDAADVDAEFDAKPPPPALMPCDPATAVEDCGADRWCEVHARVCVDCVTRQSDCDGPDLQLRVCEAPQVNSFGVLASGGFFEDQDCGSGSACHPGGKGTAAECRPEVCGPGFLSCEGTDVEVCNATGTELFLKPCTAGHQCYEGVCGPPRHNILLLFDTSGSMAGCVDQDAAGCGPNGLVQDLFWPVCDDLNAPRTLIGLAKQVFREVLRTQVLDGRATVALQRFPQREATSRSNPGCHSGWFTTAALYSDAASAFMTGDEGILADTEDAAFDWFEAYRTEAIVGPFPSSNAQTNASWLARWFDGLESRVSDGRECSLFNDTVCPHQCATSTEDGGEGRCFIHDEPELRTGGNTPLGKSLWYSAEYFRRDVFIDGQPCNDDSQCRMTGYICEEGACVDHRRNCRDEAIVVFTDGEETVDSDATSWFHPVQQARVLAGTRGCSSDLHCPTGPVCEDADDCLEQSDCPESLLCPDGDACAVGDTCYISHGCTEDGWCEGGDRWCKQLKMPSLNAPLPGGGIAPWGLCHGDAWASSYIPAGDDPRRVGLWAHDGSPRTVRVEVVPIVEAGKTGGSALHTAMARAGRGTVHDVDPNDLEGSLTKQLQKLLSPTLKCP